MNVLTISQALGNREGEGSVLSLTASYVEEVNLDALELQEQLLAEGSRGDFQGEFQEEKEREKPAGEQQQEDLDEPKGIPEHSDYPLEAPASSGERDFPCRPGASLSGTQYGGTWRSARERARSCCGTVLSGWKSQTRKETYNRNRD